jgi:hypothetical protein
MPNPNRPQYQDTIEETWGQAVADTVVRRYANTADRDADLAGFTPAELMGQLVVIAAGVPAIPYIQEHDGARWRGLPAERDGIAGDGLLLKAGDAWGISDGTGFCRVTFVEPFPNACLGVACSNSQAEDGSEWLAMMHYEYTSRSNFIFVPRSFAGAGHPGGNFHVQYLAWGN